MRCPVCKADNTQGPLCRRCKADLALLFQLEEQRQRLLQRAQANLAAGRWVQAVQQAEDADRLLSDEESRRLLAVAYLLNRDFDRALQTYQAIAD